MRSIRRSPAAAEPLRRRCNWTELPRNVDTGSGGYGSSCLKGHEHLVIRPLFTLAGATSDRVPSGVLLYRRITRHPRALNGFMPPGEPRSSRRPRRYVPRGPRQPAPPRGDLPHDRHVPFDWRAFLVIAVIGSLMVGVLVALTLPHCPNGEV